MLSAVVMVGVAVVISVGANTRSASGLNRDLENLRQFGQWTATYAADFEDLSWTLTAAPNSQWAALRPTGNPLTDGAKHAIDIIRRRTGREAFPLPGAWLAHALYSHLALADYADMPLPDRRLVATGDVHRMNWTDDPENKFDQGFWQPFQPPQGGGSPSQTEWRWPYSSSYTITPAWYDEGQNELGFAQRMYQGSAHNTYGIPGGVEIGAPRLSDVAFPSEKVLMQDYGAWYTRRDARYYGIPDAEVSVLLSDGAAESKRTEDANPGWNPQSPSSSQTSRFAYNPRTWEPPTSTGGVAEPISAGYYRWTRGGILGRDFGGSEIDTGQR